MPDGPRETPFHQPLKKPPHRDPFKIVPVLFILFTIAMVYLLYACFHLLPLLQLSEPLSTVDQDVLWRGTVEAGVFHFIVFMLLFAYVRCVLVHPGEVPNQDPWLYSSSLSRTDLPVRELKADGQRRHCKWCGKYKPDRSHHCQRCHTCILRMDHHCPWIYNCVGHHNYKYFFLLLFYAVLATHFIVWTMIESMIRAVDENEPFEVMFGTLFGITVAFFLGSLVTPFWGFHIWLVLNNMSTIEFCEKRLPNKGREGSGKGCCGDCFYSGSMWDLGCFRNVQEILGWNPLLWLIPLSGPAGHGLSYPAREDPFLQRGIEAGRGQRRNGSGGGLKHKLIKEDSFWNYGAMHFGSNEKSAYDEPKSGGAMGIF